MLTINAHTPGPVPPDGVRGSLRCVAAPPQHDASSVAAVTGTPQHLLTAACTCRRGSQLISQSVSQSDPPARLLIYLWNPLQSGVLCLNPSNSCWVSRGNWLLACSVSSCRVRKRTSGWVWNRTLLAPPLVGWRQKRESINQSVLNHG